MANDVTGTGRRRRSGNSAETTAVDNIIIIVITMGNANRRVSLFCKYSYVLYYWREEKDVETFMFLPTTLSAHRRKKKKIPFSPSRGFRDEADQVRHRIGKRLGVQYRVTLYLNILGILITPACQPCIQQACTRARVVPR